MTKTSARIGLTLTAILAGVICGQPLAPAILIGAAYILANLADYGMRSVEQALTASHQERIDRIAWQLRTDAAHLALQARRLAVSEPRWTERADDPALFTPAYGVSLLCGLSA